MLSQSLAERLPSQTVNANTRWGGPGEPTKEAEAVSFPSQRSQLSPGQGTDWEQPDGMAGRPALPTEAGIALGSLGHLGEGSTRARSSLETDGFKERLLMGRRRRASIFVMKINIPSLSGHLLPTHPESKPVG